MDTLYVVETEEDIFLGRIEFVNSGVIIRTGFRGHPKHIKAEDIVQMCPASMHPAIENVDYIKAI